jgi:GR25 family glycosyltransferase involved in LPS biosynthesis
MRIGITTDLRHSMFSAGHPNACLSVAEIFQKNGNEVIFLHQHEGRDWWDDVLELKDHVPRRTLVSEFVNTSEPLDLLIEIAFHVSPLMRPRVAHRCVWYNRKPGLFTDLEASVYGSKEEGRDLEGVAEIWLADCFTTKDDVIYLQTLYPKIPIEIVPWIWTPTIVETYRKQLKSPVWLNSYQGTDSTKPWSLHICESNVSNMSSCTLPLVISKYAIESRPFPVSNIHVHNMELLEKVAFFKENVLCHARIPDIKYSLVGRQRCIDWVYDPRSVIISHSRFISIKVANLEAAWVGIPVIHNNELLRDLGNGLESLYYKSNSVTGAAEALHKVIFNTETIPYLNSLDALTEVRKSIMRRWYPDIHAIAWVNATKRVTSDVKSTSVSVDRTKFVLLFTDMWDRFNESHNTFTLAMQTAIDSEVVGYSLQTLPPGTKPDLVVFGPFGSTYTLLPDEWPKVHFTGENTPPVEAPSVKLNIGFSLRSDHSYLRMPLWMFSIDWFGADLEKIQNPLPIPVDTCTLVHPDDFSNRNKFCAFIVTNPANEVRNAAFFSLHSYKPVDSAGRLYNNIGEDIFAGAGGGGGELKKHAFLKSYRFSITYENTSAPGYTTEKLLHAKAAGCVPIYWGDPSVESDFDQRGFINANGCKNSKELVELVSAVESNPELWKTYASIPALTVETRDRVRKTFSEMVSRFLKIAGKDSKIPELLGAASSAEADLLRTSRQRVSVPLPMAIAAPVPMPIAAPVPMPTLKRNELGYIPEDPLVVTGATQRFWPYVVMWLDSIKTHRATMPKLTARVYVASDVSDISIERTSAVYSEFAEFIRYPVEAPGFPDFWAPKHYAWKAWIYNTVVNDPSIKGRLVFYMDSASTLVRWPLAWIQVALDSGISFLDDTTQKNKQWCHSKFCEILKVTETEKQSHQIAACLILFVAGHPAAVELFSTAYSLSQVPDVIIGEKWQGYDANGQPYGHRHDQSILSILGQRMNVPRVPLDTVYCDKSARATFYSGKSVYVHRGNYKTHTPYLPGIDEVFAINLDRREDRKATFLQHHSDLKGIVRRLPAYDGRAIVLGPYLARMFKPNDFHWKKAVMGCALSHLKLLHMLVNEPPDIQAYCILEDDCRLEKGWQSKWVQIYPQLPDGWDCVYLGGVLPPNKPGLANVLERIAPGLARIAPNQIFGQTSATRYFHFCTYSYVISRAGAKKILSSISEKSGYWTSADHMMCNPVDIMNNYVLDPLVAGASQDDDPIYKTADFNNFSRVDNFDSDLWNNDDRFTAEEVLREQDKQAPLDIESTLSEADGISVPVRLGGSSMVNTTPRFISLDVCKIVNDGLYELAWLQELFHGVKVSIEPVSADDILDDSRPIIVVLRRPLWTEQGEWLKKLFTQRKTFKVIHLSDEFMNDPIDFYMWPCVTAVVRMYYRPDLPVDPKILVIPLGYHWTALYRGDDTITKRSNIWSFAGTNWADRSTKLAPLKNIHPNTVLWYKEWRDPDSLCEKDYMKLMADSIFIPCPRGTNVETYRFYEALESGCIPVFVDDPDTGSWMQKFNMGEKSMNFFRIPDWSAAAELITMFKEHPTDLEEYRRMILKGWADYKMSLKQNIRKLMIT